jgi:D-3-phosphoglycerate dehydrogenase
VGHHILISCMHVFNDMDRVGPRLDALDVTWELADLEGKQQLSADDMLDIVDRFDGIVAGDDQITEAVLKKGAANRLKIVAKWGIGIDGIDTAAAERLGVAVQNTPGMFGDEIADYALGYLLMLHRHLHRIDAGLQAGEWPKLRGTSPRGRTLGVVGLGSSGAQMVRRGHALGMQLIGYDVVPPAPELVADTGLRAVDLDELFSTADVVCLHVPLLPATHQLVDADRLASMKQGAMLINVARGPVVDEAALIAALDSGHLGAAALDVFEVEPLPADSPLRGRDNVILGSHNASNTYEAVVRTTDQAIDNVLAGMGLPS